MDCPNHRLRSCCDEGLSGCGGPLPLWNAVLPLLPHPTFPSDRHLISRVSVNNTKELELQQGSSLKPPRCLTSQLVVLQAAAKAACDRAHWHGMGLPGGSPGEIYRANSSSSSSQHPEWLSASTRKLGHKCSLWGRPVAQTICEGKLDSTFVDSPSLH